MTRTERAAALAALTDDATAAILAEYDGASPEHRAAGARWYPSSGAIVAALAAWSGVAPERVAAALAALSPRNPWRWNVQDAAAFAWAAGHDGPMPTATTFASNQRTAWRMLTSHDGDWLGDARKVRAFVAAILGDVDSVVVDVWAMRVATRGRRDHVGSVGEYDAVAAAYTAAARARGVDPRTMQAATWLSAQSRSAARHSQGFKRGTLDIVRALVDDGMAA
jgi:hypothetical protein